MAVEIAAHAWRLRQARTRDDRRADSGRAGANNQDGQLRGWQWTNIVRAGGAGRGPLGAGGVRAAAGLGCQPSPPRTQAAAARELAFARRAVELIARMADRQACGQQVGHRYVLRKARRDRQRPLGNEVCKRLVKDGRQGRDGGVRRGQLGRNGFAGRRCRLGDAGRSGGRAIGRRVLQRTACRSTVGPPAPGLAAGTREIRRAGRAAEHRTQRRPPRMGRRVAARRTVHARVADPRQRCRSVRMVMRGSRHNQYCRTHLRRGIQYYTQ